MSKVYRSLKKEWYRIDRLVENYIVSHPRLWKKDGLYRLGLTITVPYTTYNINKKLNALNVVIDQAIRLRQLLDKNCYELIKFSDIKRENGFFIMKLYFKRKPKCGDKNE